jgi:hypothetical protein
MHSVSYKRWDRSTPYGRQVVHCIRVAAEALRKLHVRLLPVSAPPITSAKHMETIASAFRRIKNSDERGVHGEESNDPVLVAMRGYGREEGATPVLRCEKRFLLGDDTIEFYALQQLVRERMLIVNASQASSSEQPFRVRSGAEQRIKHIVKRMIADRRLLYSLPAGAPAPTRIGPSSILVEPGLPVGFTSASETLPRLCEQHEALAGINGGFFLNMPEELMTFHSAMNDIVGLFLADGKLNPPPIYCRGGVFFPPRGRPEIRRVGISDITLNLPQGLHVIHGGKASDLNDKSYACAVNPKAGEATKLPIIYTRSYGSTTPDYPDGCDLVIVADRVVEISESGNTYIPYNGFVLRLENQTSPFKGLIKNLQSGRAHNHIHYEFLNPALRTRVSAGLGAGPILLRRGKKQLLEGRQAHGVAKEDFGAPQLPPSRFDCYEPGARQRHPRSAIAITAKGDVLLVTIDDDRQVQLPGKKRFSIGATLPELTAVLQSLGAVDALNLDGGGSATLWYNGKVPNHPSDGTPRLISTAIVVKETP